MRKILLLTALCFCWLGQSRSHAQNTFAPVGAEWWYFGTYFSLSASGQSQHTLIHATVSGDTVIQGTSCRKIDQTASARTITYWGGPPVVTTEDTTKALRSLYVYDNVDTAFIYNENFGKFTPLYVFNAIVGDTICIPVVADIHDNSFLANNPISGDTSFCFVIDSIKNVVYDSDTLKTFYNHFLSTGGLEFNSNIPIYNWSNYFFTDAKAGSYAVKIGGTKGGLLPVKTDIWIEKPTQAIVQNLSVKFRCYQDANTDIKLVAQCDSLPPQVVGISPLSASDYSISIYPNPSNGRFSITLPKPLPQASEIHVTDLSGRRLTSLQLPSGQTSLTANLEQLSSGTYLLLLQAGAERYYHKLVIRR